MRSARIPVMIAILALTIAAGALASGCGGDDGGGETAQPGDTGATGATGATGESGATGADGGAGETVAMSEFKFKPDQLSVERGSTLTVKNEGQVAHNLKIERGPDPKEETEELAGTDTFLGGKSEELEVDLPPAKYAIVCTVPGHRDLGMTGTITVK